MLILRWQSTYYDNIEKQKEILCIETADISPCNQSPNNVVRRPSIKEAMCQVIVFCSVQQKRIKMFYSLIIKHKKLSSSLNIAPIKILQRTKLVKNIILRNFRYVTFSQKVNIKQDIQNFLFWAPNKPLLLRNILKIHIAYILSQNKPVLHTEFHGNRFSRSPVMPVQTDRQTKKNLKNVIFVFSVLNYTCWDNLFKKNRKLQEIYALHI